MIDNVEMQTFLALVVLAFFCGLLLRIPIDWRRSRKKQKLLIPKDLSTVPPRSINHKAEVQFGGTSRKNRRQPVLDQVPLEPRT